MRGIRFHLTRMGSLVWPPVILAGWESMEAPLSRHRGVVVWVGVIMWAGGPSRGQGGRRMGGVMWVGGRLVSRGVIVWVVGSSCGWGSSHGLRGHCVCVGRSLHEAGIWGFSA